MKPDGLEKTLGGLKTHFLNFYRRLPREVWAFLVLTVLSVVTIVFFVNLVPLVDNEIFFSSDDPQFQSEHLINRLFVRKDTQLIVSASGDIFDKEYRQKVAALSEKLLSLEGISTVNSLTHSGPAGIKDALRSPLWKRIIVSDDQKSSNLIALVEENQMSQIVPQVEAVLKEFRSDDFQLKVAGLPYVIELIKRNLQRDLTIFSVVAFFIFGFLIFSFFHSKGVLFGTLIACLNACMWTFMATHLLNIPMGLLTANLGTIVFVMTLSHIIFLTYNWKHFSLENVPKPVEAAIGRTFPPAFWSMLTTFLGFLSLLSVPAKPLRDLGFSGAVGSLIAIAVAYGLFPSFLKVAHPYNAKNRIEDYENRTLKFLDRQKKEVVLVVFISCILALPGLRMIDSDPSLLSYFSKNSEIYEGLRYIDRNGGSSPLILVVRSEDNDKLSSDRNYSKLWYLQENLEMHREVGSVISLPVLIAQAKDSPFGWMLPKEMLLNFLDSPQYDKIAKSFVTQDRKYGVFMLRMKERYRSVPRIKIVDELKDLVVAHGFYPEIVGGVYNLQGHLAKLVASSLIFGLSKLILFFGFIAWFISRSVRVALAVAGGILLIPLTVLGLVGIYRIPLDIISAPACNVAIAMGIDAMIHMIKSYRRSGDWQAVRNELGQPILTSMFVVSCGFAIFLLSSSPPTQRFGAAILFGTVLSTMTALFILPLFYEYFQLDKIKKHLKTVSK